MYPGALRALFPGSRLRALARPLGVLLAAGCGSGPPAPAAGDVRPPVESLDALADRPVEGKLRGRPFLATDVRYVTDRRSGNEHVELSFSAARSSVPCGALDSPAPLRVWLRRSGTEPVAARELRLVPGTGSPWALHYQLQQDGEWVGSGSAAALVRFEPSEPATVGAPLRGALAACFADGEQSCVAGRFTATACPEPLGAPVRGTEPGEPLPQDGGAR